MEVYRQQYEQIMKKEIKKKKKKYILLPLFPAVTTWISLTMDGSKQRKAKENIFNNRHSLRILYNPGQSLPIRKEGLYRLVAFTGMWEGQKGGCRGYKLL